ncbi:hypothetical protein PSTT_07665 [Puccinia striiformis]|uniref:Uncharacterized protein n=1 Tax=Puccinia striiformis TaxID=27350 RepID=A0A2S4VFE5_9BASI|nr:hypothetical protein PSTT_07665 [Puccinia striiformis]
MSPEAPSLLKTSSWTPRASQGPAILHLAWFTRIIGLIQGGERMNKRTRVSRIWQMAHWLLFLLLAGKCLGLTAPQERILPTPGELSEQAGDGVGSIPFSHTIPIEPNLLTGPPKLRQSGTLAQSAATSHHDSHEPDSAEKLQSIVTERPAETDQTTKSSPQGSNINATGGGTASKKMDCAICLGEFDITALER